MDLNIDGSDDLFYRYKMPAVQTQILGNNTTVITNLSSIANAINRTPDKVLKFLKSYLHTAGNKQNHSVNGERTRQEIQDAISAYIKKEILCKKCGNPETVLEPTRKRVRTVCKACGASY